MPTNDILRRSIARAVLRLARPAHDTETDPLRGRPLRVLFIHEGTPDEVIMALGAVRAVAAADRGTIVDILTSSDNVELLHGLPYVNDVIAVNRSERQSLADVFAIRRRRAYDVVIDGAVDTPGVTRRSMALMFASRAPYWLGESGRAGDRVFNVRSSPAEVSLSYAMRTLRVVAPLLPDETDHDPRPKLVLDDIERGWAASYWGRGWARSLRILVEISADAPERRWPADRFAFVLDHLRCRAPHATIVVAGVPHRAPDIELLATRADALLFTPSWRQMMAMTASADLVVTADGAVAHVAAAFRRTLVSLHAAGTETRAPLMANGCRLFSSRSDTLLPIALERVISALDAVLDEVRVGTKSMTRTAS